MYTLEGCQRTVHSVQCLHRMSMQEQYFLVNVYARGLARDVKEQYFLVNVYTVHVCLIIIQKY